MSVNWTQNKMADMWTKTKWPTCGQKTKWPPRKREYETYQVANIKCCEEWLTMKYSECWTSLSSYSLRVWLIKTHLRCEHVWLDSILHVSKTWQNGALRSDWCEALNRTEFTLSWHDEKTRCAMPHLLK